MLNHAYLFLAHDDLGIGEGGNMYAYLAEEMGGEFGDGGCTDDELAVDAHEPFRVELALCLFKRHRQCMGVTRESA